MGDVHIADEEHLEQKFYPCAADPSSTITKAESQSIRHCRDSFLNGRRVLHERVGADGVVTSHSTMEYHKKWTKIHYYEQGHLTYFSYDYEYDGDYPFQVSRVLFDVHGHVIYPQQNELISSAPYVLNSVEIDGYSGEHKYAHLELPKKRDMFDFWVAKAVATSKSQFPVVHGPDTDVFHRDFEYVIAWIRGISACDYITLHPTRGTLQQARIAFEEKADVLSKLGVSLSYENLDATGRWFDHPEELGLLDFPFLSLTLDVSHLDPSVDLVHLYERVRPYLRVVHLSNRSGADKDLPYRQGDMNVVDMLHAMRSDNFSGYIIPQYHPKYSEKQTDDIDRLQGFFS